MGSKIDTIIFDLGGVLIDWNPEYVFLEEFGGDRVKMKWFFDHICTSDWNENQDAGYSLQQATEDRVALFPEHEKLIRMYYGRWEEMLGDAIEGTVDVLKKLVANPNYRVYALTNWSAETFPIALGRFEFLHWFEGIVVSGTEKTRKPFKDIYELILNRYDIVPEQAVFIDDNLRNIEAARKLKINGIHFTSPDHLKESLHSFEVVV
ncbi:MAG: HAD family phosphatase [Cyclobacteriaceae bacterium]